MKTRFSRLTKAANEAAPRTAAKGAMAVNFAVDGDGWVEAARVGEFPHKTVGNQVVTETTIRVLADWINAAAANADWPGCPIYVGHPWDAPALGWVRAARVAGNVLEVLPEWSEEGADAVVANKQYKFVSIGWLGAHDAAGNYVPETVDHFGLTNRPNIKGLAPICNAEGWLDEFLAGIRELLGDAENQEDAADILWRKWDVLTTARDNVEHLQNLVWNIGRTVGVQPGEDGSIEEEALTAAVSAANASVDAASRLERELADEVAAHNARIVDDAIALGRVDGAKRAQALAIAAANRVEALDCWFGTPAAGNRRVPPSPIGNAQLPDAAPPVGAAVPANLDHAAVADAIQSHMAENSCDMPAAHAAVWQRIEKGEFAPVTTTQQ